MTKEQAIDIIKCLAWHARPDEEQIEQAIKALEQHSECEIFIYKENCFGGATENECNHCDYKVQTLEQQPYEDEVQKVVDYLLTPKSKSTSEDSVSRAEVRKIAKEMYLEVANMDLDVHTISDCISYTSSKCRQVLEDKLQSLPPVTPTFPKGATNGDMIKAMFPKDYIYIYDRSVSSWWNAPYKGG